MRFPPIIDNTLRAAFIKCPTKAKLAYFDGLSPPTLSIHLHAGACFARGVEITRRAFHAEHLTHDEARAKGMTALIHAWGEYEAPADHTKSMARMLSALDAYFLEYPLATDVIQPFIEANGDPAVEFTFALPLEDTDGKPILNPETGDPLIYGGRFDLLGVFNDSLFVVDEKTTSALGAQWASQWEMASQFTGYCWAAREYGYPVLGAIIRGVGLLKYETKFAQVITYRPDWRIAQWHKQLLLDIKAMIQSYQRGEWDMALDHACNDFGGCGFRNACLSPEPERWLADYVVRYWEPLVRIE
jgi:hypothetical protein